MATAPKKSTSKRTTAKRATAKRTTAKRTTAAAKKNGTRTPRVAATELVGTYRLPPLFYNDHIARDLPEKGTSTVVKRNARAVYVRMDAAALKDLRSDAQHYAGSMADGGFDDRGLIASAHATVKALAKGPRKAAK